MFHQVSRTYLHLICVENQQRYKSRDERKTFDENTERIPRMQPLSQQRVRIKMAQIGKRIERSESLLNPTGRFDGFVPLMLLTLVRAAIPSLSFSFPIPSSFRPFAIVACKYERSFIRTESNSPNNVFLPPYPDVRSA